MRASTKAISGGQRFRQHKNAHSNFSLGQLIRAPPSRHHATISRLIHRALPKAFGVSTAITVKSPTAISRTPSRKPLNAQLRLFWLPTGSANGATLSGSSDEPNTGQETLDQPAGQSAGQTDTSKEVCPCPSGQTLPGHVRPCPVSVRVFRMGERG
jgi:hypothetical protein